MGLISVIGQPLAQGWSQIISNSEQSLFCSLAILGDNAKNIGHDLSLQIEDSRPASAAELHNLLLDLLSQARSLQVELQLALCWLNPSNRKLIIAAHQGKILLKRSQDSGGNKSPEFRIGKLLESETALQILEGNIRAGDQIILLTQAAVQLEDEIKQSLSANVELQELQNLLENQVRIMDNSAAIAALFINPLTLRLKTESKQAALTTKTSSATSPITTQEKLQQLKAGKKPTKTQIIDSELTSKTEVEIDTNAAIEQAIDQDEYQAEEFLNTLTSAADDNQDIKIKISFKFVLVWINKLISFIKNGLIKLWKRIRTRTENKISPAKLISNPVRIIKRITGKIKSSSKKIKKPDSGPKIYLGKTQPRKALRIILIILIAIGLITGGWFWRQQSISAKQSLIQEQLSPASTLLDEARQSAQLDIIKARDLTNQALEIITDKQKEYESDRLALSFIQDYLEETNQLYEEISGEIKLNQLDIFFDLREVSPSFISSQSSFSSQQIYLFDQGQNSLISLDIETKQIIDLSLEENTTVKDIAASDNNLFLLNQGIDYITLPLTAESEVLRIKEEGDSDRGAIFIDFFEGFLYVFNPENRNIFRYVVRGNELSDPAGWLTNKRGIEFDQVSSFAVDGQIWIADRTGAILKFERGEPTEFNISGLEEELGETIELYASQETEFLYVLEPDKSRLLVFNYQGDLIKQINSPTLAGTNHFVVDEQGQQAFVFSGSIIYEVDLSQ